MLTFLACWIFKDSFIGSAMGITAENLAEKYSISREQCDHFAIRSQQTWADAKHRNVFDLEIVPIEVLLGKKGTKKVDTGKSFTQQRKNQVELLREKENLS